MTGLPRRRQVERLRTERESEACPDCIRLERECVSWKMCFLEYSSIAMRNALSHLSDLYSKLRLFKWADSGGEIYHGRSVNNLQIAEQHTCRGTIGWSSLKSQNMCSGHRKNPIIIENISRRKYYIQIPRFLCRVSVHVKIFNCY